MSQQAQQVAVVTGANRGIGRAIAVGYAKAGYAIAATARDTATLADTVAEIEGADGGAVLALPCDVADETSVETMAKGVLERFGSVHTVVANAGIGGPTAPMHEIDLAAWRECLSVDLDGVFLTFRAFIPGLVAAGAGSLIAISSMTGKRPLHGRTPYAAAKMGVIGLVRTLATELGPHGIRVNAVCPGAVSGPGSTGSSAAWPKPAASPRTKPGRRLRARRRWAGSSTPGRSPPPARSCRPTPRRPSPARTSTSTPVS